MHASPTSLYLQGQAMSDPASSPSPPEGSISSASQRADAIRLVRALSDAVSQLNTLMHTPAVHGPSAELPALDEQLEQWRLAHQTLQPRGDPFHRLPRPLTPDEAQTLDELKAAAEVLYFKIQALEPADAHCRAHALAQLQSCVMWAIKAISA